MRAAVLTLGALLMSAPAGAGEGVRVGPVANLGVATYARTRPCTVSNVALQIRDVPRHPDDGHARQADVSPIADRELGCPLLGLNARAELGVEIASARWSLRAGARASSALLESASLGATARRNYTNHPGTSTRGYGAALTFYGPVSRADLRHPTPGAFLQGTLGTGSARRYVTFAVDLRPFLVSNGWDRYDWLEYDRTYSLGTVTEASIAVGGQLGDLQGVRGQLVLSRGVAVRKTALGAGADIGLPVSLGVSLELILGK